KILALNHMAPNADVTETSRDRAASHQGGGAVEVNRSSIAKPLIGGRKLMMVLKPEFGSNEMKAASTYGIKSSPQIGTTSACASRVSLTAEPTAIKREPKITYVNTNDRPR